MADRLYISMKISIHFYEDMVVSCVLVSCGVVSCGVELSRCQASLVVSLDQLIGGRGDLGILGVLQWSRGEVVKNYGCRLMTTHGGMGEYECIFDTL